MRLRYYGHAYTAIFCCNYEEAMEKIKEGKIFRDNNFNFYYRLSKATISTTEPVPENILPLDMLCVTSVTTKHTYLIRIVKSENKSDVLYFDDKLEDLILRELHLWGKSMNTDKLTAFGGKRFKSYLNAIPHEILSRKNFLKKAGKALSDGFKNRTFKVEEADLITDLAVQNLEKRNATETTNKEEANKKVEKLLKELG